MLANPHHYPPSPTTTDKPALILIQNKADETGNISIQRTTTQFFQCAKEDIELDGFLQVFFDYYFLSLSILILFLLLCQLTFTKQFYQKCFGKVLFVKIPNRRHSPEAYCNQIEALKNEIYSLALATSHEDYTVREEEGKGRTN